MLRRGMLFYAMLCSTSYVSLGACGGAVPLGFEGSVSRAWRCAVGIGEEGVAWMALRVGMCGERGACVVLCGRVTSCRGVSYHVTSCHFVSCHVMSRRVVSRHVMSCCVTSCRVASCHIAS